MSSEKKFPTFRGGGWLNRLTPRPVKYGPGKTWPRLCDGLVECYCPARTTSKTVEERSDDTCDRLRVGTQQFELRAVHGQQVNARLSYLTRAAEQHTRHIILQECTSEESKDGHRGLHGNGDGGNTAGTRGNEDHVHGNTVGTGSRLTGLPWGWGATSTVIPR